MAPFMYALAKENTLVYPEKAFFCSSICQHGWFSSVAAYYIVLGPQIFSYRVKSEAQPVEKSALVK
jgi:hypothetical protein